MLLNGILLFCGHWWLLSYVLDYECDIIDKLYMKIVMDDPTVEYPMHIAIFLAGGPIRLTGELLKDRNQRKK